MYKSFGALLFTTSEWGRVWKLFFIKCVGILLNISIVEMRRVVKCTERVIVEITVGFGRRKEMKNGLLIVSF